MTDWDARYQAGDTPWDKGAAAPPLIEWLEKTDARPTGRILVPGCGLGHDARAIASACPGAEVLGLDLSPTAVSAAEAVEFAGRTKYQAGDLFALPAEFEGRFDWVFEHTCFCAIDPALRAAYVKAVAGALKDGGRLLAIFYLNPHDPGEDQSGPPFGVTPAELDALFSPAFDLLEDTLPTRSYPGREGRERLRLSEKRAGSRV